MVRVKSSGAHTSKRQKLPLWQRHWRHWLGNVVNPAVFARAGYRFSRLSEEHCDSGQAADTFGHKLAELLDAERRFAVCVQPSRAFRILL